MDRREINASLPKTNIKGKPYVLVKDRVAAFRDNYLGYGLITEELEAPDGEVKFKAIVINPEGQIVATGHAHETVGDGAINRTSAVENAETSAMGRALGSLGIGIDESFASANEVQNAMRREEELGRPIGAKKAKDLAAVLDKKGFTVQQVLDHYRVDALEDLTAEQYADCLKGIG